MNKIKFIFVTFMLVATSSLKAQSFNINSLTGKTWKAVSGYNYSDKVNMNVVSAKVTLTFKGEKHPTSGYYRSDVHE